MSLWKAVTRFFDEPSLQAGLPPEPVRLNWDAPLDLPMDCAAPCPVCTKPLRPGDLRRSEKVSGVVVCHHFKVPSGEPYPDHSGAA